MGRVTPPSSLVPCPSSSKNKTAPEDHPGAVSLYYVLQTLRVLNIPLYFRIGARHALEHNKCL